MTSSKVPLGIQILPSCGLVNREILHRIFIGVFTFLCYTSYHLSRKPISVVKSVLHQNCTARHDDGIGHQLSVELNRTDCSWPPFDGSDYSTILGNLDSAFLFAYAFGMFISGYTAERLNIRYFLTFGMLGSGMFTVAFGLGYFLNIHALGYFIVVQVICGFLQSTGWPCMVAVMGNWFGKNRRGFIMGVWNSHTSVGNILGSVIAGFFVNKYWGWSFAVPGIIVASVGVLAFFFLVVHPKDVDCEKADHHGTENLKKDTEIGSFLEDGEENEPTQPLLKKDEEQAVNIFKALTIPGVVEFSLCLFFAKLVSYTFLFWLPKYISTQTSFDAEKSADLSTLFDVGGIVGGILAGVISDRTGARASTCMVMLIAAAPSLYLYDVYGSKNLTNNIDNSSMRDEKEKCLIGLLKPTLNSNK